MSARLADRQIRAAALRAAPTLDVRGPVSEALGRAGIVVPPVDAAPPEPAAPPPVRPRPALSRKTVGGVAAPEPVVKPFEAAPWPTRAGRDDERALSGLTADERRVHRILLDSLEREASSGGAGELTYLEKKRLGVLDLAFINAQLAKMDRPTSISPEVVKWGGVTAAIFAGAFVGGLVAGVGVGVIAMSVFVALLTWGRLVRTTSGSRRQIYEALRELALLVDDAPVSAALDQADRLIDQFAGAVPETAPPRTAAPPRRVRS